MAKVVSITKNPAGTYTLKFDDKHSEIMSQADALAQGFIKNAIPGINTGTIVKTAAGAFGPGNYSGQSGTIVTDPSNPNASAGSNFTVPINGIDVKISDLLDKLNDAKVLAQTGAALRAYGIIPKGTKSQQSIINAYTGVLIKAARMSQNPNDWMSQFKAAGGGPDVTVTAPSTNISTRTYTPDTIRSIADQIFVSKLGRNVTDADLKLISTQLNAKEKAQPTVTKTVPKGTGTVTQTTTSGGIDEQGVITKQAEQMPEYQRMQNLNFAGWLSKAMQSGSSAAGSLANG